MSAITPEEHCCLQNSVWCTAVHIEPQIHMTEEPMAIAGRCQSLILASICSGLLKSYTTTNLAAAAVIVGLSGFSAVRGPEVDHSWKSLCHGAYALLYQYDYTLATVHTQLPIIMTSLGTDA